MRRLGLFLTACALAACTPPPLESVVVKRGENEYTVLPSDDLFRNLSVLASKSLVGERIDSTFFVNSNKMVGGQGSCGVISPTSVDLRIRETTDVREGLILNPVLICFPNQVDHDRIIGDCVISLSMKKGCHARISGQVMAAQTFRFTPPDTFHRSGQFYSLNVEHYENLGNAERVAYDARWDSIEAIVGFVPGT